MKENNLKKLSVNITSIAPQALNNYSKKPDKKGHLMKLPKLKTIIVYFITKYMNITLKKFSLIWF